MAPVRLEQHHKRLLLCEGPTDAAFFQCARDAGLVSADIAIIHAGAIGNGNGITSLHTTLTAFPALTGAHQIARIGIFADCDSDPVVSLTNVRMKIEEANRHQNVQGKYSVPDGYNTVAQNGQVAVTIFAVPEHNMTGCLETVIFQCFQRIQSDNAQCVDAAVNCANIQNWPASKLSKAKVSMSIAAANAQSPSCSLSLVFRQYPELFPINAQEFAGLFQRANQI